MQFYIKFTYKTTLDNYTHEPLPSGLENLCIHSKACVYTSFIPNEENNPRPGCNYDCLR